MTRTARRGAAAPPSFAAILAARKKPANVWFVIYYFLSSFVVWIAARQRWSPNQITAAGFGLNVATGIGFFCVAPDATAILLAFAALTAAHVLDCADGQLAFVTDQRSPVGAWLDGALDIFKLAVVTLCLERLLLAHPAGGIDAIGSLALAACLGPLVNYAVGQAAMSYRPPVDQYRESQLDLVARQRKLGAVSAKLLSHVREYGNLLLIFAAFALSFPAARVALVLYGAAHVALALNRVLQVAREIRTAPPAA